jgi:hydrocephalus-inducing protein
MEDEYEIYSVQANDCLICSVECLYPNNDYLRHTFESGICISPGKSYDMTFTFCPREAKKYIETVQFEINGLSKQSVQVIGTGTELKVSA